MEKVHQFLDYSATHPDDIITYHDSDMVLVGHSDASYLSESKAQSRAGRHFFMSRNTATPPNNGAVMTITQIIKAFMFSDAEDKLASLLINLNEAFTSQHALGDIGHKQLPTPVQIDNTTTHGVVTNNISIKRLKATYMRLHWLRFRATQGQFRHF